MSALDLDLEVAGRLRAVLAAEPGEVVAVIGPNGAGKSTLLSAVAGLVPVTGRVRVGGRDWNDPPLPVRERRIGLVLQERSLVPHLSALDNVAFGPRSRGTSRAEARGAARDWLARLGVEDLADRRPDQLSGGQAQRVAIARALVTDPALLLLDEPFAGLDVGVATALRVSLAQHLSAYAGTTLLVTHDALDALTLADRVLVLDGGQVAQVGTPHEVAARPSTEHVARLVGLNVVREGDEGGDMRSFPPSAVTVSTQPPQGSARLTWHGRVAGTTPHGDALRLLVTTGTALEPGPDLLADVTPGAAVDLRLTPGREVWLSVKETASTTYRLRP